MSHPARTAPLSVLFRPREISFMRKLCLNRNRRSGSDVHRRLVEYITPLLPRINQVTGQENLATYLAYAVEYAFLHSTYSRKI